MNAKTRGRDRTKRSRVRPRPFLLLSPSATFRLAFTTNLQKQEGESGGFRAHDQSNRCAVVRAAQKCFIFRLKGDLLPIAILPSKATEIYKMIEATTPEFDVANAFCAGFYPDPC